MDKHTGSERLTRREFFDQAARKGVAVAAVTTTLASDLSLTNLLAAGAPTSPDGLPDCGPPPQAKPQRRKAGEAFGPLPLPVTPLRRTEKKRPPAPPALVGKLQIGSIKWKTVNGKRTAVRDWMTDPNDIKSLLNWVNTKLGIHYRPVDAQAGHFSFDPTEIPALLLAGHNDFRFTDRVRAKLQRYVLDGGMLIGDACCGWPKFDKSFRREMEAVFPKRPLLPLELDDPLLASYFKFQGLTYQRADKSTYEGKPCIEGITIGCRLGVVYSPKDLSCGWDGHDHPWGDRVVIDQARQVGANYITYLLANYQLARFLSTEKVYHEKDKPTRDDFVFAQLMHSGDWDPDPSAVHNLLKAARRDTTLDVKFKKAAVDLTRNDALGYPVLYMTGHREFQLRDTEVKRLRAFLKAGGMLVADACCGRVSFDRAFRRELAKVLPNDRLKDLPGNHPLYTIHHKVDRVTYTPLVRNDFGDLQDPMFEGITKDGRLVVLYSRFDLGNGWERFPHPYSRGYSSDDAIKLGTNILVYAMSH